MSTTLMICLFSAWLVAAHSEDTYKSFRGAVLGRRADGHLLPAVRLALPRDLPPSMLQEPDPREVPRVLLGQHGAQGFSVAWWTNKHCTHHAVPNVHGDEGCQNGDPDIDTMPLLAWSRSMLAKATTPLSKKLVKHQALTYFPLLLSVARLSWLQQSLAYVLPGLRH